ncbi:MAG: PhzF family phenazine biosynthesis protein [Rhodospirillales bacterium]|nr:PhzF family phenazine biosynthesis protein [Rhodospirillales bacterium]
MNTSLPIYQIDAFTDRVFGGNPAAVCPLGEWLADAVMQAAAVENNLSETAFFVSRDDGDFDIRWFTPGGEIDLAGHPTLATAWLILNRLDPSRSMVRFHTKLGDVLEVAGDGDLLVMDFPARPPEPVENGQNIGVALGAGPLEVLASRDLMAVFETEDQVLGLTPDMAKVAALDFFGVIATAPGRDCDFVSRFFAPKHGIPEDPVTGSAHCTLIPYWAGRLGKDTLHARQISARGGELFCENSGARVKIAGRAVLYMEGMFRTS